MKTLQLSRFGAPTDVVELAKLDPADPGPGQLAVSIEAAPINPSDLNLIRGIYGVRPKLPAALGAEGVGRVIAVGDGVDGSRVGTRVLIVPTLEQATWREQAVLDERNAVPVDLDGDPLQLAMLGINPITAHCVLHGYVKLAPGAWVAQTGASSATAGYVRALAKHAGLRTLNVVRRAEFVNPLLDAGADVVLVEGADLTEQSADAIGDASLELIIDAVAGEPVAQLASLLSIGGQIVSYTARARQPLSIPVVDLIFRGLSVHGFWLNLWLQRTPPDAVAQIYRELATLVADGTLAARIEATYALADYREAIAHAAQNDSIEINRPAEEVFAYLDQVDRHNEWQAQLVSTTVETDGPVRVGTRVVERRNVPGGARDFSYDITEHDPARKISFRGTAGLIRPVGTYTVDPTGESSSRMSSELDLEGHGIGKLFATLARRQAAKEVPVDQEKFKKLLESGVAPAASD